MPDLSLSAKANPQAALLIIGAEILSGKIDDANGPFLVRRLRAQGVATGEIRVIGDDIDSISSAVNTLRRQFSYVLTTGGIGPTHDDVTLAAVAQAFATRLVRSEEIWARIVEHYDNAAALRKERLALVPESAELILGPTGIVPVTKLDNVYVFPGVPGLMRRCFEHVAKDFAGPAFCSRAAVWRISETRIAEYLATLQTKFSEVAIGSYPSFDADNWQVKVTVDGRDQKTVNTVLDALLKTLPDELLVAIDPDPADS